MTRGGQGGTVLASPEGKPTMTDHADTCPTCGGTGRAPARMLTVAQLVRAHPQHSEGAVRRYIFDAERNGLKPAIDRQLSPGCRRPRVLINEGLYLRWLRGESIQPRGR